ncbi:MAG TPA: cellulase family glycosylhydrolase [Thermomicrobiales bacterium]|nr:cellulase family glycosylhydrolase [Thermomicrobiales bacterium]
MTSRSRVALCILLLLGIVALEGPSSTRAADGDRYFPETGFWVPADFAEFWETHGGLMTLGYPISRVFYQDSLYTQYFERAIFERHEDKEDTPYVVLLTRIGANTMVERMQHDPEFRGVEEDARIIGAGGLYFHETNHHVSPTFAAYWEENGGLQAFGYPISEPLVEDGRPVQYFERARFERHEELAGTPFEVLLGHLGREALAAREVPALAVEPQEPTVWDRDAPAIGPLPVGQPTGVACGFVFSAWNNTWQDDLNQRYLDAARASGCGWIRMNFTWYELQSQADTPLTDSIWPFWHAVDLANARGLKVMATVSAAPGWARPNDRSLVAYPEAYGAVMGELATMFAGKVAAWQLWNEPNMGSSSAGATEPEAFLPLLRAAYPAIKAADPSALVVLPALAPSSLHIPGEIHDHLRYLEELLWLNGGEAGRYFDVLGIHAYGAGNNPDTWWPGNLDDHPGWVTAPEFYFRTAERSHAILVNAGLGDRPIWITEMGWPVGNYNDVWGFGEWITEELQAEYTARAFEVMREEWHWVDVAFIFILNAAEYGGEGTDFTGFSVFRADGTPRPVYDVLRKHAAAWQYGER